MYYHDPFTVVASFLPPAILVCLVVQLVLYLLGSAGLYAMANNTGMKNPWTAWIPIAREHLLGSLAAGTTVPAARKNPCSTSGLPF